MWWHDLQITAQFQVLRSDHLTALCTGAYTSAGGGPLCILPEGQWPRPPRRPPVEAELPDPTFSNVFWPAFCLHTKGDVVRLVGLV